VALTVMPAKAGIQQSPALTFLRCEANGAARDYWIIRIRG